MPSSQTILLVLKMLNSRRYQSCVWGIDTWVGCTTKWSCRQISAVCRVLMALNTQHPPPLYRIASLQFGNMFSFIEKLTMRAFLSTYSIVLKIARSLNVQTKSNCHGKTLCFPCIFSCNTCSHGETPMETCAIGSCVLTPLIKAAVLARKSLDSSAHIRLVCCQQFPYLIFVIRHCCFLLKRNATTFFKKEKIQKQLRKDTEVQT